jgi:hypothetical protein
LLYAQKPHGLTNFGWPTISGWAIAASLKTSANNTAEQERRALIGPPLELTDLHGSS